MLDAYSREGRAALRKAGGTEAGRLYVRMLLGLEPEARIEIGFPADPDGGLPPRVSLDSYDGVAWTGSNLRVYDETPGVRRQIELARAIHTARVPSFGSCWAAQLCAVASGGRCEPNPRGREFGVARSIVVSAEGRAHPLYRGKPARFGAFSSHADHVVELPDGATRLASNGFTPVQALALERDGGLFWAVQYHPEYDPHEVASLCRLRMDELVRGGAFPDHAAARSYVERLEKLHSDPSSGDAAELGLGPDVLDVECRTLEVRNWIEHAVKVRRRR